MHPGRADRGVKSKRKPPQREAPLRPRTKIVEIESDSLAADLVGRILTSQARTRARKAARKEQRDDAA